MENNTTNAVQLIEASEIKNAIDESMSWDEAI